MSCRYVKLIFYHHLDILSLVSVPYWIKDIILDSAANTCFYHQLDIPSPVLQKMQERAGLTFGNCLGMTYFIYYSVNVSRESVLGQNTVSKSVPTE